jgi:hypothetical protein
MCHILVGVHIEAVNDGGGMDISTIVIVNVNMLGVSLYDASCNVAECNLFSAIIREWRCVFAMYIPE